MIAKLFMGGAFKDILARFEKQFASVEVTRRSRRLASGPRRLYGIARGFRS
jgi:23S rRNA U2552 (ribose-2'-O)-methylase RlmE/FtsJ